MNGLRAIRTGSIFSLVVSLTALLTNAAQAQYAPTLGYMHPAGVAPGQTIEVTLGGYDWTPDMQLFVHDPRIKAEFIGPPGPVTIPEPPFWFGKKARRPPFPIPREFKVRLTVGADVPPGIVRWQAANANGVTNVGKLVVGTGPEIVEKQPRKQAQVLETLPVTVSAQIKITQEVDQYRFKLPKAGPVTCVLSSRGFDSPINGVLEIRDDTGRLIADAADTAGNDTALTFVAEANRDYTASVYDVDFRGDRSFTYRLLVSPGPRVVATIPASGRRGETRPVEFVGYGIATGAARLESVTKPVTFPTDPQSKTLRYVLDTAHGNTPPVTLGLSDFAETVEPADANPAGRLITVPGAVTGTVEELYGEDRYRVAGKKGDQWQITLDAARIGSPLDVTLAILDAEGKELVRSDDVPGTTDAELLFAVPADAEYQIVVADVSGRSGTRAGVYRLEIVPPPAGYTLGLPDLLPVPLGGKGALALKVVRTGGFKAPINITVTGLPAGSTAPDKLVVPEGQAALSIEISAAADAAATASAVTVSGESMVGDKLVKQSAGPMVVALTLKAPFSLDAEGLDDVSKWPRGATFPGPVLIERDAGFSGEIMLEMHSRQGRVIQGIWGPELPVAGDVKRILYPIYLPEWLETTRTSRMVVNGVAKIPDPKGNVRYSLQKLKTRIGFLPGGAMMKLASGITETTARPGGKLDIPVTISRNNDLTETATLELILDDETAPYFSGEKVTMTADKPMSTFPIQIKPTAPTSGEFEVMIRATLLQHGKLPVISESRILVTLTPPK
jgi:hypothetical protein